MPQPDDHSIPDQLKRYAKQIRFAGLGIDGQRCIADSTAIIIGCGALGSVSANLLARAGVGNLILIDRDFVELSNLQRQVIYDEKDLGLPKAIVAKEKLSAANSTIEIVAHVTDIDFRNVETIFKTAPTERKVVVDGTDNFETRFLINDACVKHSIPWIYGGCLGADGQVMTVVPRKTACLHCLMIDGPPPPGTTATCDSAGILSTIINVIASLQVNDALKILSDNHDQISTKLQVFDLWGNRNHNIDLSRLRDRVDCPCCKQQQYPWLDGKHSSQPTILCGRNAVQVSFPERRSIDLNALAKRLEGIGKLEQNPYLVRLFLDKYTITAFADGRAIINGTEDISVAKNLYSQYLGA